MVGLGVSITGYSFLFSQAQMISTSGGRRTPQDRSDRAFVATAMAKNPEGEKGSSSDFGCEFK